MKDYFFIQRYISNIINFISFLSSQMLHRYMWCWMTIMDIGIRMLDIGIPFEELSFHTVHWNLQISQNVSRGKLSEDICTLCFTNERTFFYLVVIFPLFYSHLCHFLLVWYKLPVVLNASNVWNVFDVRYAILLMKTVLELQNRKELPASYNLSS